MKETNFHRDVHVWIKNEIGGYFIIQHREEESNSFRWGPLCGNVRNEEEPEHAAIRLAKEQLGLTLYHDFGSYLFSGTGFSDNSNIDFVDVLLFDIDSRVLQKHLRRQRGKLNIAVVLYPAGLHFLQEQGLWVSAQQFDYADQIIGSKKTISNTKKKEWIKTIDEIKGAGFSLGAVKQYESEYLCMKKAYDMTQQRLSKWPEEIDDHDCIIADIATDLFYSLINLERYPEAKEYIDEALEYYHAVFTRGKEIYWHLYNAHWCKRRIMIRTGNKKGRAIEYDILKRLRNDEYPVEIINT